MSSNNGALSMHLGFCGALAETGPRYLPCADRNDPAITDEPETTLISDAGSEATPVQSGGRSTLFDPQMQERKDEIDALRARVDVILNKMVQNSGDDVQRLRQKIAEMRTAPPQAAPKPPMVRSSKQWGGAEPPLSPMTATTNVTTITQNTNTTGNTNASATPSADTELHANLSKKKNMVQSVQNEPSLMTTTIPADDERDDDDDIDEMEFDFKVAPLSLSKSVQMAELGSIAEPRPKKESKDPPASLKASESLLPDPGGDDSYCSGGSRCESPPPGSVLYEAAARKAESVVGREREQQEQREREEKERREREEQELQLLRQEQMLRQQQQEKEELRRQLEEQQEQLKRQLQQQQEQQLLQQQRMHEQELERQRQLQHEQMQQKVQQEQLQQEQMQQRQLQQQQQQQQQQVEQQQMQQQTQQQQQPLFQPLPQQAPAQQSPKKNPPPTPENLDAQSRTSRARSTKSSPVPEAVQLRSAPKVQPKIVESVSNPEPVVVLETFEKKPAQAQPIKSSPVPSNPVPEVVQAVVTHSDPPVTTVTHRQKMEAPQKIERSKSPPPPVANVNIPHIVKPSNGPSDQASVASHSDSSLTRPPSPSPVGEITMVEEVTEQRIRDPYGDKGMYTGVLVKRRPHGRGTMKYDDGRHYEGHWNHGRWHGVGRAIFANNDIFEGSYDMDQRHGHGMYQWNDGRVYTGQFFQDQRQGRGTYTWPDGAVYQGEFKAGHRHGQGMYRFADGSVYTGEWENGKYHGVGECRWSDGRSYRGEWKEGRANGYGVETRPNGTIRHDGEWKDDRPIRDSKRNAQRDAVAK